MTGNSQTQPWRIGGKSLNGEDRVLYSKTAISDNITKIEVTHGAASSITVNSWTVIVSKNSDFSSPVSTLTPTFTANTTTTINRPDGVDWSNCYYKFVYNVTVSGDKNKFLEFSEAKFYKEVSGGTPTTYTVTYNANGGTGTMTDDASPYNAGATVTVLDNEFTRDGYIFDHWNTSADNSGTDYDKGDSFTINANTTLYAQWTVNGGGGSNIQTLTFDVSSNPGGWPTTNSTTLTNYTYTLNSVDYTFALKNVKCNSGYLMCTSTAVLGLPAIEGYKLTKVVAHNSNGCSTSTRVGISSSSGSASYITGGSYQTWTARDTDYTYNLSSTEANTMYYMYVTNANAQVTQLELTYEYVTPHAVATPTFNLAGGYYAGTQNVTISCETNGATIYYTTDGSTPSASNGTQGTSVSISATTTLKAIAIKDEDNSSVAEATYTILTPLTTMQEIFNAATNTETQVAVTFNNWVITGANTTQAYMTDGTKGCMLFGSGHGFAAGNILSGTVICKLVLYYGKPEFKELTAASLTVTPGGNVTPVETTIDALGLINAGSVVTLNNLTYNGSKLTDGTNSIEPYNGVGYTPSFETNKTYNVTGVFGYGYGQTNDYKRIFPRGTADIQEVVSTDPTISTSTTSLSGFIYGVGNGPSAAQTIAVSGSNLEGDITLAMNDGESSTFEISLSENSGYTNTLTLTQTDGTVAETTVYVRMKAGLAIADYDDEINLTSTNATTVSVSLAGTVTPPAVTWDLRTNSYSSSSTTEVDWTSNFVNMTLTKGTSGTSTNNHLGGGSYTDTRFYKDQVLTFAPVLGYAISSIEITAYSTSYANAFKSSTWSNATVSTSNDKVTIEPTNGDNNVSVTFTSACWAYEVKVYYTASTATPHAINLDADMVNGTVVTSHSEATAGTTVTLYIYPAAGYYLEDDDDIVVDGTSTVTLTKVNAGTYSFVMPDKEVTVYAIYTEYNDTYYTLVSSIDDIIPGIHYIISNSKTAGSAKVMGGQNGNYRDAVDTDVIGNTIYATNNVREFVISGDATNNFTLYDDATAMTGTGYLYAGNNNVLRGRTDNSENNNHLWSISISEGVATIVSQIEGDDNVTNTIKYNYNNGSNPRFTTYKPSSGMASVYLYKKANDNSFEYYGNTVVSEDMTLSESNAITVKPDIELTFSGDVTLSGADAITVQNGGVVIFTGTLNSDDASYLVVEDGGQLIVSNAEVKATFQKSITTAAAKDDQAVWYTIASPIAEMNITDVTNLVDGEGLYYNLYRYKESVQSSQWEAYNTTNHADFTTLESGRGYLYRNNGKPLAFAGEVTTGAVEVTVTNTVASGKLRGFNLIGNPYGHTIYKGKDAAIDNANLADGFYYLKENGTWLPGNYKVAITPNMGILVKLANNAYPSQNRSETFNITDTPDMPTQERYGNDNLKFMVSNSEFDDVAYVMFHEGNGLNKINHRNAKAPMLFVPQDGDKYAIAMMADNSKVFGLGFKAATMGQYTLRYKADGNFNYLHVVDRLTGADVDMLLDGEYTFVAAPGDSESRFIVKLEYMPNYSEGDSEMFAYQWGSEILVSGSGELQIFDVTGRKVMTSTINGAEAVRIPAQGVYILKLNDKIQKIVVR